MKLHLGKYFRYLLKEENILVVMGNFSKVCVSRDLYMQRHAIKPETPETNNILIRFMSAAALAALSLSERESWGWSASIPGKKFGLFCGVEPEGMICSKILDAAPQSAGVHIQRQRKNVPVTQSRYIAKYDDPVKVIQQYFLDCTQNDTRIEIDSSLEGVLVQAMPGGKMDNVFDKQSSIIEKVKELKENDKLKMLNEVLIFYECHCDENMVSKMIKSLPAESRADLFEGEDSLEVECPRCSRKYSVKSD